MLLSLRLYLAVFRTNGAFHKRILWPIFQKIEVIKGTSLLEGASYILGAFLHQCGLGLLIHGGCEFYWPLEGGN